VSAQIVVSQSEESLLSQIVVPDGRRSTVEVVP